eukprot:Nitzschia sp. Nitz4//scaffold56_size114212//99826//101691//NITZ4_003968-RA/size114212-processed-gene-0.38-mRNA-1//-1//CDS//3329554760//6826//frame0
MAETPGQGLTSNNAWASLLGLISPFEYLVTVDHSVLWQRHVAWAKPKGEDLRAYVTQRFASNMVVLSLMLGAQINVFFNSSVELTEMRRLLGSETYSSLKFWIGIVISLDACVTIMALVATFTLWGMISAISDTNAHALLRSSIGQYVISMPPRFVVGALYLFILWLFLAIMDFTNGPARIVLAVTICFLFFQVIIPLSAFGRLIIHTGAMAKRRVLDEEFEKELLPSGLHASLLIRATGQRKKYSSVISQYQKRPRSIASHSVANSAGNSATVSVANPSQQPTMDSPMPSPKMYPPRQSGGTTTDATNTAGGHKRQSSAASAASESATRRYSSASFQESTTSDTPSLYETEFHSILPKSNNSYSRPRNRHLRTESGDASFPRPAILNAVNLSNLSDVVKQAIEENELEEVVEEPLGMELIHENFAEPMTTPTNATNNNAPQNFKTPQESARQTKVPVRELTRQAENQSKRQLATLLNKPKSTPAEWAEELTVKDIYSPEPAGPGNVLRDLEAAVPPPPKPTHRPRPSFLNRDWGLGSLGELLKHDIATPESSVGEAEEEDGTHMGEEVIVDGSRLSTVSPMWSSQRKMWGEDSESSERQGLLKPSGHRRSYSQSNPTNSK